jgi:hypothetical protein
MLADIWSAGRLSSDQREESERLSDTHGNERSWEGWKKMGLHVDGEEGQGDAPSLGEIDLFRDVGELGLECLVRAHPYASVKLILVFSIGSLCMRAASAMSDLFHIFVYAGLTLRQDIMEQRARPQDRQCPIGIAR